MSSLNENDYLQLAEDSKKMYEKQQDMIYKQKREILELKKKVINAYSLFRLIDEMVDDYAENEDEPLFKHPIQVISEVARSNFSDYIEELLTPNTDSPQ